jgi:hypothetical protein
MPMPLLTDRIVRAAKALRGGVVPPALSDRNHGSFTLPSLLGP